eukprot:COSAG02_NODE_54697_length_294_cov_1.779487_1_plen_27_part_10
MRPPGECVRPAIECPDFLSARTDLGRA